MHMQAFCAPPVLDECNGATDHHRWWRLMPTRGVSALLLMTALVVVLVVFELPLLAGHSHRRRTTVVAAGSVLPDDVGDRRAPSARSSRKRGRHRRRLVGGRLLVSGLRRRRRLHGEMRVRRGRADVPPRAVHYRRPARLHVAEKRQARLRNAQHRHEERRTTEARGRCCESMRAPFRVQKRSPFSSLRSARQEGESREAAVIQRTRVPPTSKPSVSVARNVPRIEWRRCSQKVVRFRAAHKKREHKK